MLEALNLNAAFGPVAPEAIKLSLKNQIAVRTDNGYRAFDVNTKKFVNVTDFCLDAGNLFVIMPTRKLKVADVILVDGRFKCVTAAEGDTVKALDYNTGVIEEFIPERYVLFGKKFYGKVTCLLGDLATNGAKGNKLIKLSLVSKALGGNVGQDANSLLPLLLLGGKSLEEDGDNGMIKTFMLARCFGQGGQDMGSLLPLLLLSGKGGSKDLLPFLLLQNQQGGNFDVSQLLLMQMLGGDNDEDSGDLFGGLFEDDEDEPTPEAPAIELA